MSESSALNLVVFLPLVAAVVLAFVPRDNHGLIKWLAFLAALINFFLSLTLLGQFQMASNGEFQLLTEVPWVPQFGVQYKVGVDGISLILVLLTTLLSAIAILSSFENIQDRLKEYYIFLLVLETGMLGCFVSLDLILFYVFWEAMLIPMYFLIGIWGGARRAYATIKFVLYTLVGSILMLVAIVWLYVASGQGGQPGTFDLTRLIDINGPIAQSTAIDPKARLWLFLAFAAAFAIKVPMFPLHTWLPDAHVEAPTAGSVILAGVLLKMGTYGFIRFCIPLFPDVALQVAPWFLALSVIGIIYGALVAYVQKDVKRLVAYSSVSHLGFCVLGLFAFTREAVAGSVLQMINHGLSTGALFLLIGMIYERRHTREISEFGGLWKVIPVFTAFLLISMLSSVGLPGLNGFVGEFLILLGTWGPPGSPTTNQWFAVLAATGVILGAVYLLWMFQRMMQGPLDNPENERLLDLSGREVWTLLPLVVLMFWIGAQPSTFLGMFDAAVYRTVVEPIETARMQRNNAAAPATPQFGMPGMGHPGMGGIPSGLPSGHPSLGAPAVPPSQPAAPAGSGGNR